MDRVIGRLPGCGRGWELLEVEPPPNCIAVPADCGEGGTARVGGRCPELWALRVERAC